MRRELFADHEFRLLLGGQATTMFGDSAMILVLGIWVKQLTGSSSAAGLIFMLLALSAPLAPFTGLLVDRLPRRRVLIGNDLLSGLLVLSLLLVRAGGDVWIIYLVALGYGLSIQVYRAARAGLVHSLLAEDLLGDANGIFSALGQGLRVVGPLLGAGLFAWVGGGAVAALDAATFGVSAGIFAVLRRIPDHTEPTDHTGHIDHTALNSHAGHAGHVDHTGHTGLTRHTDHGGHIRPTGHTGRTRHAGHAGHADHARHTDHAEHTGRTEHCNCSPGLLSELVAGARHIVRIPELRQVVFGATVAFGVTGLIDVAVFAMVDQGMRRPATFIAVLGSVQGAGSVLAGLMIGRVLRRLGELAAASAGFALCAVGLLLAGTAWLPAAVPGALVAGLGLPTVLVANLTLLQRRTPGRMQGRVVAAAEAMTDIPFAVSIGCGVLLIGTVGFRPVYYFCAGVFGVVALAMLPGASLTRPARPTRPTRRVGRPQPARRSALRTGANRTVGSAGVAPAASMAAGEPAGAPREQGTAEPVRADAPAANWPADRRRVPCEAVAAKPRTPSSPSLGGGETTDRVPLHDDRIHRAIRSASSSST